MASPCADASSRCQLACGNRPFLDELRMAETWVRRRNTIDTLPQPHVHLHTEYRELLRGFVPALHVLYTFDNSVTPYHSWRRVL
jgi:hypothetical protein